MENSINLNGDDTLLEEILERNLNSEQRLIEEIKFRKENFNFLKSESNGSGKKKRSSSKMGAHPNSRIHMHRPSVRSISEQPNVIGASRTHYTNDACSYVLIGLTWFLVILFFPFSFMFIFRVVQEYERGKF